VCVCVCVYTHTHTYTPTAVKLRGSALQHTVLIEFSQQIGIT